MGGSASQTTAESGESVDVTADPAPIGQRFVRWSSDKEVTFADATAPSTTFAMPESDVTITANFAPIGIVIVKFDSWRGSSVPPASVAPGNPIPEPTPPTRAGYSFEGWYTDGAYTTPWNFSDPVTGNMTLYAKWTEKEYTITVVGGSASQTTAKRGERVDITADSAPSGQHFIGWSSDVPTFFGNHIQPVSDFYMPASDVTITAHFAPNTHVRVTFFTDGGSSIPPASVVPGNPIPEPAPPTRAGYSFEGWYRLGVKWNFSDPVTEDMDLDANWIPNTYTVTVIGGTSDLATARMGNMVTVTANPAPSGQRFVNWSSDKGVIFVDDTELSTEFLMPASDVTITANFVSIANLAVIFDSQGGSTVAPAYVAPNTPVAPPAPPTRAGYSFEGWYTDGAYTTPWNFSDPVTADMVLYAKWNSSTSTGTGSGGGDKDKPEKPEMPKAPKEDQPKLPDIVEVFDESSPKHETKAPSAMKTAGVLKIGSLDYQALEKGVLVKKKLDTPPIVEKGKTMLPARAVGELLGVSVSYDAGTKTAVFVYNGKKVELTMGKKTMKVNGVEKALSAPMMTKNGRVLLPLRDVQQALKELGLEASVNWEHKTKTITIQVKR
ncbi:MAG: InlB B-repeat-containing protein [Filifactor alocis]|nr:InlB B-repeat-containing protein [Filifactor alocis]